MDPGNSCDQRRLRRLEPTRSNLVDGPIKHFPGLTWDFSQAQIGAESSLRVELTPRAPTGTKTDRGGKFTQPGVELM